MTGKTILLVEDNQKVMRNNITMLTSLGASVLPAETLAEARSVIANGQFDAAALDIMLPDGSGLDLLREIRRRSNVPVLLLTARGESQDVVTGLSLGADDYIAKPYDMDVFAARINALLRRTQMVGENIIIGPFCFDLISSQVFYDGKDLFLTQKEFALLLMLAQNERKVLPAEYLFEKVWGQPPNGDTSVLKVRISNLKKKLADAPNVLIETSRNEGYCLTIL